VGDEFF
jgi:hypothetical protein